MADTFLELAPSEIRYTHDSILSVFSNPKTSSRTPIMHTLKKLVYGVIGTDDIEPMAVFRSNGYYWSANNRRLWVFRQYERLGGCNKVRVRLIRRYFGKVTTTTGGKEIEVRDGGVSGFPANLPNNILKFDTTDASATGTHSEGGRRKALTKDQIALLERHMLQGMKAAMSRLRNAWQARKNERGRPTGRQDGGAAQDRTSPKVEKKKERKTVKTPLTGMEENTAAQNRVSRRKEKKKARKKSRRLTGTERNFAAQDSDNKVLNDNRGLDGDHGLDGKNVLGEDSVLHGDDVQDRHHVQNEQDGRNGLDFDSLLEECFRRANNNMQHAQHIEIDKRFAFLDDLPVIC